MNEIEYTASAFILNRENKILLIWHDVFNRYVQPGGHIKENELPYEAAIRKVYEETGINVDIPIKTPFAKEDYYNSAGHQVDYQYIGYLVNDDIHNSNNDFKAGWFGLEDLEKIPVVEDLKEKYKYVLRSI